jgi:hypothetical protein
MLGIERFSIPGKPSGNRGKAEAGLGNVCRFAQAKKPVATKWFCGLLGTSYRSAMPLCEGKETRANGLIIYSLPNKT